MENGTTETETNERGTVTTDRETTAMVKVLRLLDSLTPTERDRVLRYVVRVPLALVLRLADARGVRRALAGSIPARGDAEKENP